MHFAADLVAWDLQVGQMGNTHEHHGLCEGRARGRAFRARCRFLFRPTPGDKKRTGRNFPRWLFLPHEYFFRTTADRDERTKAVTVATAQIPLPLGTLFGHFTRHLHHEHIDELLVLVQRHLQLPLELLANVMRRERRQIAMGDHIDSQPME